VRHGSVESGGPIALNVSDMGVKNSVGYSLLLPYRKHSIRVLQVCLSILWSVDRNSNLALPFHMQDNSDLVESDIQNDIALTGKTFIRSYCRMLKHESVLAESKSLILSSLISRVGSEPSFSTLLPNHESILPFFRELNYFSLASLRKLSVLIPLHSIHFPKLMKEISTNVNLDNKKLESDTLSFQLETYMSWIDSELSFFSVCLDIDHRILINDNDNPSELNANMNDNAAVALLQVLSLILQFTKSHELRLLSLDILLANDSNTALEIKVKKLRDSVINTSLKLLRVYSDLRR